MNKRTVKYGGKTYTAEFNLDSLCFLEDIGFKTDDFGDIPFNALKKLLQGAFYMHHEDITSKEASDIYMKGVPAKEKSKFVSDLVDMYTNAAKDVMGDEGNEEGTAD